MLYPEAKILLFTKAPRLGEVKTRLIPDIGQQAATDVHKKLLLNTLRMLDGAALSPVELWCAPNTKHPFFDECRRRFSVTLHCQKGEGLGDRMHYALSQHRGKPALLIGSDIPLIDADYLHRGLQALMRGESWVFGPAEDGGYVLVGCCESDYRLFSGVEWGGSQVLQQTINNAERCGVMKPTLLETLWDLDNVADLKRWHKRKNQV